ncbi:hypothetical protein Tco_1510738 [Tanacetum coccineum]
MAGHPDLTWPNLMQVNHGHHSLAMVLQHFNVTRPVLSQFFLDNLLHNWNDIDGTVRARGRPGSRIRILLYQTRVRTRRYVTVSETDTFLDVLYLIQRNLGGMPYGSYILSYHNRGEGGSVVIRAHADWEVACHYYVSMSDHVGFIGLQIHVKEIANNLPARHEEEAAIFAEMQDAFDRQGGHLLIPAL